MLSALGALLRQEGYEFSHGPDLVDLGSLRVGIPGTPRCVHDAVRRIRWDGTTGVPGLSESSSDQA